jgi:molybdate transport system ATP-binding protein
METLTLDLDHPLRSFRLAVTLEIGAETVALVGPSGAGKSTVLRAIAGLLRPERGVVAYGGTIWLDRGRRIDLPPDRRRVGMVFQEYALFPHLDVRRNVSFGARDGAVVPGLLDRLGVGHLAGARPGELSGGERQRVALARALAREPQVLLLDEPLSALDAHTRRAVRGELHELLDELRMPTLLVTHDFEDAATLADRVGVIVQGSILQLGTPQELVAVPRDPFVASFTGANLLPGTARPGRDGLTEVVLDGGGTAWTTESGSGRVSLAVYPWEIALSREMPDDSSVNHIRAPVVSVVTLGNRVRARVGPVTAEVTAVSASRLGLREGEVVVASFKATGARLLAGA